MVPKETSGGTGQSTAVMDRAAKERREAEQARIREMYGDASATGDAAAKKGN